MHFLEDEPQDPDCTARALKACDGEPFFGEHEDKRYCVLHFPGPDKKEAFNIALKRKQDLNDFEYQGVWFPDRVSFHSIEIGKGANFSRAVFNGSASFTQTTFKAGVTFDGATFTQEARFGQARFVGEANFSSVTFQKEADFSKSRFEAYANFWRCTFNGRAEFRSSVFVQTASFWPATFNSTASFYEAIFRWANFRVSKFNDKAVFTFCQFDFAEFIDASFRSEVDFSFSKFKGMANFIRARFDGPTRFHMNSFDDEARFGFAAFNAATDFGYSVFKDIVSFSAEHGIGGFEKDATCDFRHARFDSPRQVSFHGLLLRPHWFLNLDPRKFEFVDVRWIGQLDHLFIDIEINELIKRRELESKKEADRRTERLRDLLLWSDQEAIEELKEQEAEAARIEATYRDEKNSRFYRLLSITCRQLAVNAEENHRYDQASDFRFWSMELQRKEGWRSRGRLTIGILHTAYRYLSGYGEEILRALLTLIAILFVFAFLYTRVGFVHPSSTAPDAIVSATDEVGQPQKPLKALVYSLAVVTLQRPDPRPLTATAWSLVLAETILGPIQAALLILAVRRRFMR